MKDFQCSKCGTFFARKISLNRHLKLHDIERSSFKCSFPGCLKVFSYSHLLKSHYRKRHGNAGEQHHATRRNPVKKMVRARSLESLPRKDPDQRVIRRSHSSGAVSHDDFLIDSDIVKSTNDVTVGGLISPLSVSVIDDHPIYRGKIFQYKFITTEKANRNFTVNHQGQNIFRQILEHLIHLSSKQISNVDKCKVQAQLDTVGLDYGVSTNFIPFSVSVTDNLLDQIEAVVSSSTEFNLLDPIYLNVRFAERGAHAHGIGHYKYVNSYDSDKAFLAIKRSVWAPPESCFKNSCFLYCVAYGLSAKDKSELGKKIFRDAKHKTTKAKALEKPVKDLAAEAGIPLGTPLSVEHWARIRAVVQNRTDKKLDIALWKNIQKPVLFYPENIDIAGYINNKNIINILVLENAKNSFHCYVIKSPTALCGKNVCTHCGMLYSRTHTICKAVCYYCRSAACVVGTKFRGLVSKSRVKCMSCRRIFLGRRCANEHLKLKNCGTLIACSVCFKTLESNNYEKHRKECGYRHCLTCKKKYDAASKHECFIDQLNIDNYQTPENFKIICFDIESFFDENGYHKPYLICAIISCQICFTLTENANLPDCVNCGKRQRVFYAFEKQESCDVAFVRWLFYSDETTNAVVFSFCGSRYDNFLVINALLQLGRTPDVLTSNGKILQIKNNKRTLKDLFLFTGGSLDGLAISFGFRHKLKKTIFPHKFACLKNLYYIGDVPGREYFMVDRMNDSQLNDFNMFYNDLRLRPFDFRNVAVNYCLLDCMILYEGLHRFWRELKDITKIDFIFHCITISNLAQIVYRTTHMPEKTLGLVPVNGYTDNVKANSLIAIKYLAWLSKERGIHIQTSVHGKEKQVFVEGKYRKIDGYHEESGTVFQVNGCGKIISLILSLCLFFEDI